MIARAVEQIQKRFRHPHHRQLHRELKLRLEERRKERGRIARELHDTLFQGFLGASLMLAGAVEQTPADSPTKPSLSRALQLMHRVMDEGRLALQDLRSSATPTLSLEEALYCLWDELAPSCVSVSNIGRGAAEAIEFRNPGTNLPDRRGRRCSTRCDILERQPSKLWLSTHHADCAWSCVTMVAGSIRRLCGRGGICIGGLWGCANGPEVSEAQVRIWSRLGAGTEVEISVPINIVADAPDQLSGAVT